MTGTVWRRLAGVSALLAVVLVAAACQLQPGAAAFVGDQRIPDSHVDQIVDSSIAAAHVDSSTVDLAQFRQQVTDLLVQEALLRVAADRLDVQVSDQQVNQAIDADAASTVGNRTDYLAAQARQGRTVDVLRVQKRIALLSQNVGERLAEQQPTPSEAMLRQEFQRVGGQQQTGLTFEQARPRLIRLVLVQQYMAQLAGQVGVRVNPRYGQFDGQSLQVVPLQQDYVLDTGGQSGPSQG